MAFASTGWARNKIDQFRAMRVERGAGFLDDEQEPCGVLFRGFELRFELLVLRE
jgi:hypothetical protein